MHDYYPHFIAIRTLLLGVGVVTAYLVISRIFGADMRRPAPRSRRAKTLRSLALWIALWPVGVAMSVLTAWSAVICTTNQDRMQLFMSQYFGTAEAQETEFQWPIDVPDDWPSEDVAGYETTVHALGSSLRLRRLRVGTSDYTWDTTSWGSPLQCMANHRIEGPGFATSFNAIELFNREFPLEPIPGPLAANATLLASLLWAGAFLPVKLKRHHRRRRGLCMYCRYDMSRSGTTCPECGARQTN